MGGLSRFRHEGREAFQPGEDPKDYFRYKEGSWDYKYHFDDFLEGWEEAEAEYVTEQEARTRIERKEFEGNILVTISENEVRLWVCNQNGENIFRFKALGQVYSAGKDITIL